MTTNKPTGLRRYQLGKYHTMVDALIHSLAGQGWADEETGDVERNGYHWLLRGPIEPDKLTTEQLDEADGLLTDEEAEYLGEAAGFILRENNDGFVSVTRYEDVGTLDQAWDEILEDEAEDEEDDDLEECDECGENIDDCECGSDEAFEDNQKVFGDDDEDELEPQDEDLWTSDHINVYRRGNFFRPPVLVTKPETFNADVRAFIESDKYNPNVWFVSDHGNWHLIDISQPD